MNLGLLGGGRMGEALASGLIAAGWEPESIAIAEIDAERRHHLEARLPGARIVPSPAWAAADVDVLVVAVKPSDVTSALEGSATSLPEHALVLSIAAGVSIATLEAAAPGRPVVRAMPNTPALVGLGASAIAAGGLATDDDLDLAERVLGAVGTVARVPEHQLDAVTGVSGSGPAYVFLLAEAMMEAGVLVGLPRASADALVRQTLLGAATLLMESGETPESLRAAVTSPGGTTAAAVKEFETHGFRSAVLHAVEAAARRSREIESGE
ncbi:MAG TPA: pyrroline-5-carboxylate reductase [Acidimicrobiia bacterium]|nr:pyrroline-5-carboxylate reductase [Acidimicrobiia bacterium]